MNALFVQVLRLGLNAVPVILIVLLARLLLRRAPKRFSLCAVADRLCRAGPAGLRAQRSCAACGCERAGHAA